jgi:hypothetical protein
MSIANIIFSASYVRDIPAGAEILRSKSRGCLKASTCEYHTASSCYGAEFAIAVHFNAKHRICAWMSDEVNSRAAEPHSDASLFRKSKMKFK